ncbi:FAS1-like dehydratase domain-containing protein [Burkholderia ubonensis]|uniref:Acyl-CoA dehydrogenase n=1 Tax=Burkholderia ubonensis subsp. mesacidophila TaxID=265293 RepID=A0A2A4EUA8_9BURK|nr:MaoC family dehydratase N-terminal domain-containing protein [Burkholderia ubonensis]PCE24721.1 acyl-CoA dehydrogenase [Burkholderia ubonensis subsp. mesacidophila]
MSGVDIVTLREWLGRSIEDRDVLSVRHARLMAATVGSDPAQLTAGAPLPPLWHWLYFLEGLPPEQLGRDGHPRRGGFLPPVPLPNRMWAGGRVRFHAPLPLGADVTKRSTIRAVEHKHGRSGELVFVTVLHEILHAGAVAIAEEHDIVYKEASPGGAARPAPAPAAPCAPEHRDTFVATSTTLFRYSALTFNGHRIHYDQDYCRDVEGYPNLVIHGPLNATLLAGYAERVAGRPLRAFHYRGVQPALLGNALTLNATRTEDGYALWTALPDDSVSMRADAMF